MSAQLPVNDDSTAGMSVHGAAGCEKHPKKNFHRHSVPQMKELFDCVPYYFSCIVSSVTFFHNLDFFFFLSKRSNRKSQRSTKKVANNPFLMVIFKKKPQEQSCNHTNVVWTCYYTVIVLKLFSAWEKLDGYGFLSIAAKHALQHVCQLNAPSLMSEREAQTGWGTRG